MTYRGHVQGGVVLLDDPHAIPDGTVVDVCVAGGVPAQGSDRPTPGANSASVEQMLAAIWADVPASEWANLPHDLTDQLDHYLYGTPKK